MDWLGVILYSIVLIVIFFIFIRQLWRQLSDPTWSAAKNLTRPSFGSLFVGFGSLFTRLFLTLGAIWASVAFLLISFLLTYVSFSQANPPAGVRQYGFKTELDSFLTRDFFPIYSDVIFPALSITGTLAEVVIPVSNLYSGSVYIINNETKSIVFNCEKASIKGAALGLTRAFGNFMQSILLALVSLFSTDPQLIDLETPFLNLQQAYDDVAGIPVCACEVLSPAFESISAVVSSPGVPLFFDGFLQIIFYVAPVLDALAFLIDLLSRIFEAFFGLAFGQTIGEVLQESWFVDLTHEPHFERTALSATRAALGFFIIIDDGLLGTIRAFYPPLKDTDLPRLFTPLGHYTAALIELYRLYIDVIFHMGQAFAGVYSGHIQAGLDPVEFHFKEGARLFRETALLSQSSFGEKTICIIAGISDGYFGTAIAFLRAIIGLVRSGRDPPRDFAVSYTSENATKYFQFLRSSVIRDPWNLALNGWFESATCSIEFFTELSPWTAFAWREITHVFQKIIIPFRILIDELPLYEGTNGYFSSGNDISAFKIAVQNTFDEAKSAARSFGNVWSSLMDADFENYTQTEYGTFDTTSIQTRIFETDISRGRTVSQSNLLSTLTTEEGTFSFSFGGVLKPFTVSSYIGNQTFRGSLPGILTRTYIVNSNTDGQRLGTGSNPFPGILSTVATASNTKLGSKVDVTVQTDTATDVFATTATEIQIGMYSTCPSLGDPHNVYFGDTIFDPYITKGEVYGWCCLGRFLERWIRLWIAVAEVITNVVIEIASKESPADSVLRSAGTVFCKDAPGDLNREFIPLISVMLDDLGCTLIGAFSWLLNQQSLIVVDLTCRDSPEFMLSKIIKVTFALNFFEIELYFRIWAFIFKLVSSMISTIADLTGTPIPGGCSLTSPPIADFDFCSSHLINPVGVQGLCDTVTEFYDFTAGAVVEIAIAGIDIFSCTFGSSTGQNLRAFVAYFGPGGDFHEVICKTINFFGKIVTLLRMTFSLQIIDRPILGQTFNQKGVINYLWCKMTDWFDFLNLVVDALETVQGIIDGIECVWGKLISLGNDLWNCLRSCVECGVVGKLVPGECPFGETADFFCSQCTNLIPRLSDCTFSAKRVETVGYDLLANSNCSIYQQYNGTITGMRLLMGEAYQKCITSDYMAASLDTMMLNMDFPNTRLVPPKTFYSIPDLGLFLLRVMRVFPEIFGTITEFVFSDTDPYDFQFANCTQTYNTSEEALELRICEISMGFVRSFREYSARGNETLVGTIVNIIGDIIHLEKPLDSPHVVVGKRLGRSSAWQAHLDKLDARRRVIEIKKHVPPLLTSAEKKKKRVGEVSSSGLNSLVWAKDEFLKMYGADKAGGPRELPWRAVWNHAGKSLERKREEIIPGYRERKMMEKAITIPTLDLPSDLLCPGVGAPGLDSPDNILKLRCAQRMPMWDAYGNVIGECQSDNLPFWEVPTCTTNTSANATGFPSCCDSPPGICTNTTCPLGDAGACAPTDCAVNRRVYGDCTAEQCETVMDGTLGACCTGTLGTGCSLQTNETCFDLSGTFAGIGTSCADTDLPLICESCRQQSCRRCDIIINTVDGIIDLAVEVGNDYFELFEGAQVGVPVINLTESVLPVDVPHKSLPDDAMFHMVNDGFEKLYNWVVTTINTLFSTSIKEIDGRETYERAYAFLVTGVKNSLSDWWRTFKSCNVHEQVSLSRGKQGVGIWVAITAVTAIFSLSMYILDRTNIPITKLAGSLIGVLWFVMVIFFAFAISPSCFFKFGPPFIGGPSLFYVVPIVNLPIIPHGAVTHIMTEVLEPLVKNCSDDCAIACPFPSSECWPCHWVLEGEHMVPGRNCNDNITNCCESCRCPGLRENFERIYPQCALEPFKIRNTNREALLYLRLQFPTLFCILKQSAGYSITTPGDWEFVDNDCTWKTEEEARQFAEDDARWRWCLKRVGNLSLLTPYLILAFIVFRLIAPLSYSILWLIASLMDIFVYYMARFAHGVSLVFGIGKSESRSTWMRPFEVVGSWMKRPHQKKE